MFAPQLCASEPERFFLMTQLRSKPVFLEAEFLATTNCMTCAASDASQNFWASRSDFELLPSSLVRQLQPSSASFLHHKPVNFSKVTVTCGQSSCTPPPLGCWVKGSKLPSLIQAHYWKHKGPSNSVIEAFRRKLFKEAHWNSLPRSYLPLNTSWN